MCNNICKRNLSNADEGIKKNLLESDNEAVESLENSKTDSLLEIHKRESTATIGLLYATCTGLFGGSMLVPLELSAVRGLKALPSFGHGVFLSSFVVTVIFAVFDKKGNKFPKTMRNIIPGILSGFIFNIGNTFSIVAIPEIGFAVAQPIMQCALFVSGMWGIFLFREITDNSRILMFFIFGVVLIVGALVLALCGP